MSHRKKPAAKRGSPREARSPSSLSSSSSRSPSSQSVTHEPSKNTPAFTSVLVPQGRIKCVHTFTVMPGMHGMLGQNPSHIQDPITLVANREGRLVRESDIDYCYITVFRDDTLISNMKRLGVSPNDINFSTKASWVFQLMLTINQC